MTVARDSRISFLPARRPALTAALAVLAAAPMFLASGCDRSPAPSASGPAANANLLPASLFLPAEPADVAPVGQAKARARQGEKVTLRGRIGGGEAPFAAERAVFTIVDPGVKSCAEMGEDHCPAPWDYCCEPRENLVANSATIQVVGSDGRPLKTGLKGVRGLDPLAEVTIVGTVSQRDDAGTFVVNAEGVWIRPNG